MRIFRIMSKIEEFNWLFKIRNILTNKLCQPVTLQWVFVQILVNYNKISLLRYTDVKLSFCLGNFHQGLLILDNVLVPVFFVKGLIVEQCASFLTIIEEHC